MNEVKFIHDALGQSTISNMATEATLKELLEAIGGSSNSTGSTRRGSKNSLSKLPSMFKSFGDGVKSFERGVKSTLTPFTGFVSLLSQNETRMSAFGTHLNDSVISRLPWVGGVFGAAAGVAIAGVQTLESWEQMTSKNVPAGATFGNSLLNFVEFAGRSRLFLTEYQTLVSENITKFNSIGPTTDTGLRLFSRFSKSFFEANEDVVARFRTMGYTFSDINSQALDFLYYTQRGIDRTVNVNKEVQQEFAGYVRQFDMLSKLLGMSDDERNRRSDSVLGNAMFQLRMNQRTDIQAGRITRAAQMATALYGSEVAEIFMAGEFSTGTALQAGANLGLLMPAAREMVGQLYDLALNNNLSEQEFTSEMDRLLANQLFQSANDIDSIQSLINTLSVSGMDQGMYGSLSGILETIVGKGIRGKTVEEIQDMIAEARRQQGASESIGKILNAISDMARNFSSGFLEGLIPNLRDVGDLLAQYNIPELFRVMGQRFAEFVPYAWDWIKDFFDIVKTPEGRDYLAQLAEIWVRTNSSLMATRLQYGFGRLLTAFNPFQTEEGYSSGDYLQDQLERLGRFLGADLGNPLRVTGPEAQREMGLDRFSGAAAGGGVRRRFELGGETPTGINEPYEGQVVYPNLEGAGIDQFGAMVYRGGRFLPQIGDFTGGNISRAYSPEAQALALEQARLETPENSNLALIQLPDGSTVRVNRKYATHYQMLVDALSTFGVPITGATGYQENSHGGWMYGTGLAINSPENLGAYLDDQEMSSLHAWMQSVGLARSLVTNPDNWSDDERAEWDQQRRMIEELGIFNFYGDGRAHGTRDEFRTGTLEETGRLFNDFGRKRRVRLTGDKAVLTREQYEVIKDASAQIPIKDMLAGLNTSVQEMINLTRREIISDREKLAAL